MTQKRAEALADEIVNDYRSSPQSYRESIIKHLLRVDECTGCESITDALNRGDGTYTP